VPKTSAKAADRTAAEAASYALGHRTRIEILAALNEHEHSASELARLVRQPLSTVGHHLTELVASGSIEVAEIRKIGNVEQKIYRSITSGFYSEAEVADLNFEERQALYSVILQTSGAEAMNALLSGAISNEPKAWLVWNRFNLDQQGWEDAGIVFQRAWDQLNAIEAESNARRAASGEDAKPYICNLQAYPRSGSALERSRRETPFDI
jgi:DNA-binding transcriptional ArsR family regulator